MVYILLNVDWKYFVAAALIQFVARLPPFFLRVAITLQHSHQDLPPLEYFSDGLPRGPCTKTLRTMTVSMAEDQETRTDFTTRRLLYIQGNAAAAAAAAET